MSCKKINTKMLIQIEKFKLKHLQFLSYILTYFKYQLILLKYKEVYFN